MLYDAADKWLRTRLLMPTHLKSKGLAQIAPAIRASSFFSAQVAKGHVLDTLRKVSDRFTKGEMDLATARLELKRMLGTQYEPGSADDRKLSNLASTVRLDLILRQNARMAMAVGEYQQGMDETARKMFPYWRYVKSTSASPRESHAIYNGKVFRKDDPIWHRIFPPSEFNCKCSVEEVAADEVGEKDVQKPTDREKLPPLPESGFSFDPADALGVIDADCIHDDVQRCRIVQEMQSRFGCTAEWDKKAQSTVIRVHPQRFDAKVQEGETYYGSGTQPMRRFQDPVSGEIRENVGEYVDSFAHKREATTNDPAKIRVQRSEDYREYPELSNEACRAYMALSEGEKHSLDAYTSRDPYRLNWAVRKHMPLDKVQQRENARLSSLLEKLPAYHGTVYRGMAVKQEIWEEIKQDLLDGNDVLKGFVSTSWNKAKALGYAMNGEEKVKVLFEIVDSSNGHFLGPVSCTPDDKEVLYAPNQTFRLIDIQEISGVIHVRLEEK